MSSYPTAGASPVMAPAVGRGRRRKKKGRGSNLPLRGLVEFNTGIDVVVSNCRLFRHVASLVGQATVSSSNAGVL
ncbi:hypothetical protein B7486_09250 [cyanobacterium TDX16]|nr:hypothetical protein B7486_09250 [cyanobacterium TDX16]